MFLLQILETMLQNKCRLLHNNNWNILILLIILPCGLVVSHKENQMNPDDNYYIHHQKVQNRVKSYINGLPFDDVDANQNNFHKHSKQSDGKFNNQPILHSFDKIQQRHQTTHMSDDEFMNRQLSHKHWGSKRSHKTRNPKHKSHKYKTYSDGRSYINGIIRYHEDNTPRNHQKSSNPHSSTEKTKHYSNGVYTLHSVHKFEDNYEPPYIKKFNRRNKQLLNLLEGIPTSEEVRTAIKPKKHSTKIDHKKDEWVETNLFEEQRPHQSSQNASSLYGTNDGMNDIPENDPDAINEHAVSKEQSNNNNNKNHSKSEKFNYHRVASPKLVGFGSFGVLRKQQLPFVAITDKRLSHSNSRSYSQQASNLSMP